MKILRTFRLALASAAVPIVVHAQMTVAGQVISATGIPVQGAFVTISELDIRTRTTADGRYNFIIRASQIRGQSVTMVARHARHGFQSAEIQVTGGSLIRNFRLSPTGAVDDSASSAQPGFAGRTVAPFDAVRGGRPVDFENPSGPLDFASALTGRVPGLHVISAAAPGASAPMFYRGPRSFGVNTQPLVVVDGVPMTNHTITGLLQQFGLGGFDYGSPLQDLPLDEVASVHVLDRGAAAMLYGSRAANGVIVVRTKSGEAISGLHLAATQRFTLERPVRLPRYQNLYGQGLDGEYEFFDGQGGGVNDAVAESWGPSLDGRPLPQHSLTEPRRPDVRFWSADRGGVEDYFGGGRTLAVNASLLGSLASTSMRTAIDARDVSGFTPGTSSRRLGLSFRGALQPGTRFRSSVNFRVVRHDMEHRPGTGYDEINPVAGFTRMGRQVDLGALRARVTDTDGEQINWIYTNRNNPWFATERNANDDERWHLIGSAEMSYAPTQWLSGALRVGATDVSEKRAVAVDSGWKGGYAGSIGRFDFTGGGEDRRSVSMGEQAADLLLLAHTDAMGAVIDGVLGAQFRRNDFRTSVTVTDRQASGAAAVRRAQRGADADVMSFYASGGFTRGEYLNVGAGARLEQHLDVRNAETAALYPFATASYDLTHGLSAIRSLGIANAALRATWWRAGNENSSRVLSGVFAGADSLGVSADSVPPAETTQGLELGVRVRSANERVDLDVSVYRERSTEMLFATGATAGGAVVSHTGSVFNGGFEATLRLAPLRGEQLGWNVEATYSRNTNTVDALREGTSTHSIAPTLFGASEVLEIGSPIGIIVGSRYLRDDNGSLILRDGLPVPDATDPFSRLGTWQPDWIGSLRNTLRFGRMELFVLVDARIGGKLFSATNMWGSRSGTLASTLVGREDSLLIVGIDSVSGTANATKVSSQDYFHALGAIHEAWVYDASYTKVREARLTYAMPSRFMRGFREHNLRVSLVARNLMTFASAPNIDPETALAPGAFQGFEMGQLPGTRSFGVELSIAP